MTILLEMGFCILSPSPLSSGAVGGMNWRKAADVGWGEGVNLTS
jgi:hypothetical protein